MVVGTDFGWSKAQVHLRTGGRGSRRQTTKGGGCATLLKLPFLLTPEV